MAPIKSRAEHVLASLGRACTWDELTGLVNQELGRPVEVLDLPPGGLGKGVTGAWLETDSRSIIYLSVGSSKALRTHTLLHEFSYILLGHTGCDLQAEHMFEGVGTGWTLARLLRRSGAPTGQEISAEALACELARRLHHGEIARQGSWT